MVVWTDPNGLEFQREDSKNRHNDSIDCSCKSSHVYQFPLSS